MYLTSCERHLNGRLMGLHPTGAVSKSCQYTVTSDFQFVIDRHLHNENIWIVSACSGHGFKHSTAIGEEVAALVNRREPSVDYRVLPSIAPIYLKGIEPTKSHFFAFLN